MLVESEVFFFNYKRSKSGNGKVEGTESSHSFKKAVLKGRREIRC